MTDFNPRFISLTNLAKVWAMDRRLVHRLVENEPGVLKVPQRPGCNKKHSAIRVPLALVKELEARLASHEHPE